MNRTRPVYYTTTQTQGIHSSCLLNKSDSRPHIATQLRENKHRNSGYRVCVWSSEGRDLHVFFVRQGFEINRRLLPVGIPIQHFVQSTTCVYTSCLIVVGNIITNHNNSLPKRLQLRWPVGLFNISSSRVSTFESPNSIAAAVYPAFLQHRWKLCTFFL